MNTIRKELVSFDNKTNVYFYQTTGNKTYLRQYEFEWETKYKKYSCYSIKNPKLDNREERLDFALSNTRSFELGQEFREAKMMEDMSWKTCWRVKEILWCILERKLQEEFKEKTQLQEDSFDYLNGIILIEISGYKYFVKVDNGYHNPRFVLSNRFEGEALKFGGTIEKW